MISKAIYDILKTEFGNTSSWTVWACPANGKWETKDSVSDMSPFQDEAALINNLNGDYIFVGLNPSNHDHLQPQGVWENFHSSDTRKSQDYKLRYALRDTKYSGCFMTDLYTKVKEKDSTKAVKSVTYSDTQESVETLLRIRDLLGGSATIVAMGGKVYNILKKALPKEISVKRITHYAAYINIKKYREEVLWQLNQ